MTGRSRGFFDDYLHRNYADLNKVTVKIAGNNSRILLIATDWRLKIGDAKKHLFGEG